VALVAAAAVVGVVGVAVVLIVDEPEQTPTIAASATIDLVVATGDGRVVIVDQGGVEQREIAVTSDGWDYSWRSGFDGRAPRISLTPDGLTAFIGKFAATLCGDAQEGPGGALQFAEVSTTNGDLVTSTGDAPAVSPDGRWLAYQADFDDSTCGIPNALVLRDLTTGAEQRIPAGVDHFVMAGGPFWTPDAQTVLVQVSSGDRTSTVALPIAERPVSLADLPEVPVAPGLNPVGVLASGQVVALETIGRPASEQRLVTVHAATGQSEQTLVELPSVVAPSDVTVDATGTVIAAAFGETDATEDTTNALIWTDGEVSAINGSGGSGIVAAAPLTRHVERPPAPPNQDLLNYADAERDISLQYPSQAWAIAPSVLTPNLGDGPDQPWEIVALGTYPLPANDHNCAHVPVNALEDLGPDDAFVWLMERRPAAPSGQARPDVFGPTSGVDGTQTDIGTEPPPLGCVDHAVNGSMRWIAFDDNDRSFIAIVAIGDAASAKRHAEAWAILNSLETDTTAGTVDRTDPTSDDATTAVVLFSEGECLTADATRVSCADPHTREDFATFRHTGSLTPSAPSSFGVPLGSVRFFV
jgi:hypothetical protein